MSALLEVSDVHVAYGKVEAVRAVTLEVRDNEIVTIVGANGAGKTTLLNAIMGILPLKGRVAFAGEDIARLEIEDRVAAGLRHMEKQQLAALLRQLRDGGMSVLLVEHDMGFVMDLADRVVVLDFGTKIAEGTPDAIKTNPDVIKAYLGAAA